MAGKGSGATNTKRIAQRARTKKNKERKYAKLIGERPNDIHVKAWQKKIA